MRESNSSEFNFQTFFRPSLNIVRLPDPQAFYCLRRKQNRDKDRRAGIARKAQRGERRMRLYILAAAAGFLASLDEGSIPHAFNPGLVLL